MAGGFRKRIEMLLETLRKRTPAEHVSHPLGFFRLLFRRDLAGILIYTSLMAPLILLWRLLRPGTPVYYMVRGDEITYVMQRNRRLRAFAASLFQRLLNALRCHFVFVCEDLRALFEERFGPIRNACVLPNTIGKQLPPSRPLNRNIAIIGDFDSVKNTEWAIQNLATGRFNVHLFGNSTIPKRWHRPWLHSHGIVKDLSAELRDTPSTVVLPYVDAGFPNVLIEALEAGCSVLVHRDFPFHYLPISDPWRFDLSPRNGETGESPLEQILSRLLAEQRDFRADNPQLIELIESNWEQRVWEIFG
jgi:hypothetical protein